MPRSSKLSSPIISEIFKSINIKKVIGILAACVSIEIAQKTSLEFKKLDINCAIMIRLWDRLKI